MSYKNVIDKIYTDLKDLNLQGKVADYIPLLAEIDPNKYAISINVVNGPSYDIGDYLTPFSIQSISKIYTLAMITNIMGDNLWAYVGKEPSGSPFNSLVQLEKENGIPRNPFINAGALVVTDLLMNHYSDLKEGFINFIRQISGNSTIDYNYKVAQSELEHSDRNMALAYFMKSFGNIKHNVNELLDIYCHQCSVEMNTQDLAKSIQFLVNHGVNPFNNNRLLTASQSKRLGAIMLTCGFYDESGDYAFRVGMPGKSGVGGGVVAYIPENLSIAVWSPKLGPHGNSIKGIETLERFTTDIKNSIF